MLLESDGNKESEARNGSYRKGSSRQLQHQPHLLEGLSNVAPTLVGAIALDYLTGHETALWCGDG